VEGILLLHRTYLFFFKGLLRNKGDCVLVAMAREDISLSVRRFQTIV